MVVPWQSCIYVNIFKQFNISAFAGLIWAEIKQLWDEGALEYIYDMWNILDFTTNSLYIATFTLRLLAYFKVIFIRVTCD